MQQFAFQKFSSSELELQDVMHIGRGRGRWAAQPCSDTALAVTCRSPVLESAHVYAGKAHSVVDVPSCCPGVESGGRDHAACADGRPAG